MIKHIFYLGFLFSPLYLYAADPYRNSQINSQQDLNLIVLEEFRNIVKDYFERRQNADRAKGTQAITSILSSGIWMPNHYFDYLVANRDNNKINALLEWMKRNDAFFRAHLDTKNEKYLFVPKDVKKYELLYNLNPGALPSEAIKNLGKSRIFFDCSLAYQLAYYRAALRFLGEADFNALLLDESLISSPLLKSEDFYESIKLRDCLEIIPQVGSTEGSVYYINNHLLYSSKDKNGESNGFNLLLSGFNDKKEPLYIGFGLDPQGLTKEGVEAHLVTVFNREPYNGRISSSGEWKAPTGFYLDLLNFLGDKTITSVNDSSIINGLRQWMATLDFENSAIDDFIVSLDQKRQIINKDIMLSYNKLKRYRRGQ